MSSMKKFLNWFRSKRRGTLESLMKKHGKLVVETVSGLHELLNAWINDDKEKVKSYFKRISLAEKEADNLRREIVVTLISGLLEPEERSILLRVIREADWIADWAHEAARITMVVLDHPIPIELKKHCIEMIKVTNEAASKVKEALDNLFKSPIFVVEKCDEVERLEEKVDDLYERARKDFIKYSLQMPIGVAILVAYLLDAIENVADRCEDTCDRLRELAVRLG